MSEIARNPKTRPVSSGDGKIRHNVSHAAAPPRHGSPRTTNSPGSISLFRRNPFLDPRGQWEGNGALTPRSVRRCLYRTPRPQIPTRQPCGEARVRVCTPGQHPFLSSLVARHSDPPPCLAPSDGINNIRNMQINQVLSCLCPAELCARKLKTGGQGEIKRPEQSPLGALLWMP